MWSLLFGYNVLFTLLHIHFKYEYVFYRIGNSDVTDSEGKLECFVCGKFSILPEL